MRTIHIVQDGRDAATQAILSDDTMHQSFQVSIDLPHQVLNLSKQGQLFREYPISSAKNGAGELEGSGCTPRGLHVIRAKIGANCPFGTVFVGRRPTGEVFSEAMAQADPKRDWILTRILWLSGCEPGRNRFGPVDTMRRYIYIHGCPDGSPMGEAASHGCVRMKNRDIVELFDMVAVRTSVRIHDENRQVSLT
jgi:L,D-transpeptidase catalytic domain